MDEAQNDDAPNQNVVRSTSERSPLQHLAKLDHVLYQCSEDGDDPWQSSWISWCP